jgi:uncharacterized protein YjbI with pentapeptide repeats
VALFDADQITAARAAARTTLVIVTADSADPAWQPLDVLELCPWVLMDCMEYMAARHRQQCASVLRRLAADSSIDALKGSPQLLALVMDRMADDPLSEQCSEVLRQFSWHLIPPGPIHDRLMAGSAERLRSGGISNWLTNSIAGLLLGSAQQRWWRHEAVQRVFAAEWIANQLCIGNVPDLLKNMVAQPLLTDIVAAVRIRPAAIARLEAIVRDDPQGFDVAMAASILMRIDPGWRPPRAKWINLTAADLRGARWAGVDLDSAFLIHADLTDADLSGAILVGARGLNARLVRTNLRGARLHSANFGGASLAGSDWSNTFASGVDLRTCHAAGANFSGAVLDHARMDEMDLRGARFTHCGLTEASLRRGELDDADFTGANLDQTMMWELQMTQARWVGASFRSARLVRCDLEGLELPQAHFEGADLRGCLLTGTRVPGGHFHGANLQSAGLAEIEWDGADLRNADFTHASFHLGSSRSGMVGSTIPSEGSRTGFYTDEYNEQDYKPPEEIRKACLCGADMRGAAVSRTDFYLVDLRSANYTPEQAQHFSACGAILRGPS